MSSYNCADFEITKKSLDWFVQKDKDANILKSSALHLIGGVSMLLCSPVEAVAQAITAVVKAPFAALLSFSNGMAKIFTKRDFQLIEKYGIGAVGKHLYQAGKYTLGTIVIPILTLISPKLAQDKYVGKPYSGASDSSSRRTGEKDSGTGEDSTAKTSSTQSEGNKVNPPPGEGMKKGSPPPPPPPPLTKNNSSKTPGNKVVNKAKDADVDAKTKVDTTPASTPASTPRTNKPSGGEGYGVSDPAKIRAQMLDKKRKALTEAGDIEGLKKMQEEENARRLAETQATANAKTGEARKKVETPREPPKPANTGIRGNNGYTGRPGAQANVSFQDIANQRGNLKRVDKEIK